MQNYLNQWCILLSTGLRVKEAYYGIWWHIVPAELVDNAM